MKRLIGMLCTLVIIFGLVACGESVNVEITDFSCDLGDTISLPTEDSTPLTFTAKIEADTELGDEDVELIGYNESGTKYPFYMSDDGLKGDEVANDGVYTLRTTSQLSDPQTITFHVEVKGISSDNAITIDIYDAFGDMLDAYWGTWAGSMDNLVITGHDIYKYSETVNKYDGKYHFLLYKYDFTMDENGELEYKTDNGRTYPISINDEGNLVLSTSGGWDETYEKVSDSQTVPQNDVEPEVGMMDAEVRGSKWGFPNEINKNADGSEEWIYDQGTVYIEDSIVTDVKKK